MRIHREGYAIIIVILLVLFLVNEMAYLYLGQNIFKVLLFPSIFLAIMSVSFFRDPVKRKKTKEDVAIVAPADGEVVTIEKVYEPEVIKGECMQVSIFMSIYNIHKNFFPIDGQISYYRHHNGHFHRAILPKSSTENERSSIAITHDNGQAVLCRQVAGAVARRVVSYVEEGENVEQAEEMGFIKFGSRVDVYLPLDADICVRIGDKTIGSRSVIAKFKS